MLAKQLIILTIALVIILMDAPTLVRKKLWGELGVHLALTFAAVILLILPTLGLEFPSILTTVINMTQPVGKWLFGWLAPQSG